MTKNRLILGIDIGGTNTKFGLVDEAGEVHYNGRIKTVSYESPETLASAIHHRLNEFALQKNQLVGIGIGAPNANFNTGNIENAPNLTWKGVVPLTDIFQNEFQIQAAATNDANAAAMGEMLFGAAKGKRNFLVITLGTGLGSGFVCNSQLLYGHTGMAGELGHVIIEPDGRDCPCGRMGCLERYASATGFMITVRELLEDSTKPTQLNEIPQSELRSEHVSQAADKSDSLALAAFDQTARHLARGLATAVAISSPELIIISGGFSQAGELLLEPTKKYFEEGLFPAFRNTVQIDHSQLTSRNAAILGAAALGWENIR